MTNFSVKNFALFLTVILLPTVGYSQDYVPGQLIVSFKDKNMEIFSEQSKNTKICSYQIINQFLERNGIVGVRELYHGKKGVKNIFVMSFPIETNIMSLVEELSDYSEVKYASPNYYLTMNSPVNDWYYNTDWHMSESWIPTTPDTIRCKDQWNLQLIQADKAWDVTKGSSDVTIAFLDSGIDYEHPDLRSNIWVNPGEDIDNDGEVMDEDDINNEDDDDNGKIDDLIGWNFSLDSLDVMHIPPNYFQHGTMMASVCAVTNNDSESDTSIAGIAWNCKIVPLHITDGVKGILLNAIEAINYSVEMEFDILNMSFGTYSFMLPDSFGETIENAYDNGLIMVASAGSFFDDYMCPYPAGYPEVIGVSAVDELGQTSYDCGGGNYVDVCALSSREPARAMIVCTYGSSYPNHLPGSSIPHVYYTLTGHTSYAAAQVSALAGLIKSLHPDATPEFVRSELMRGAIPCDNNQGYLNGWLGAGRINAYRSLTWWGDLDADTTWTGDIYVSTNYAINEGTTLTIAPGTTVHFATHNNDSTGVEDAKCALLVRGELIANGTSESPIVFKSMEDNAPAGSWYGIRLLGDAAVATLNHCIIQDAEWGVKSHRTVNMNHCEVSNCNPCGVYLFEENSINESRLAHCNISDNDSIDAVGIRIWNCAEGDTTIVVDSCTVNNNGSDGIWVSNARPWIKHSDMKYNGEDGVYVTTYQSEIIAYPRIIWCRIQENGENGMYFNFVGGYVYATRISDNSSYGIYGYGEGCNALIRYSKIVDQMTGIRLLYAEPNLGNALDATSGHNTINNSTYNVYHTPFFAEIVKAENNYWGSYPPNANKIKKNVDYSPALSSDPVIFLARMEKENNTVLKLFQNYPNPVMSGSSTKISYYLPSREKVVMRIYDVSGRRITTLVDDVQPQGMHYIDWNGKNERGNTVAPGIYFYRMMVGDQIQSKKIVLLKK